MNSDATRVSKTDRFVFSDRRTYQRPAVGANDWQNWTALIRQRRTAAAR